MNVDKLKQVAKEYWYVVAMIIFLLLLTFQWQSNQNLKSDILKLKASITISNDITTLEAKLNDMKERELSYIEIEKTRVNILESLKDLEKRMVELNKINKGKVQNDVEKLSTNDLSNSFTTLGFPNSVIDSK